MFTVTTPTWKTIDGKLYHLEPSINRTYKSGRSRTYTVREEVDIINHGVRTKTDKIKRIIDDDLVIYTILMKTMIFTSDIYFQKTQI